MTPEVENEVIKCLESGMSLTRTIEVLELGQQTIQKHRRKHPEFSARMKKAIMEGERECLNMIRTGARGWQGPAWLLGKKYPNSYGVKVDAPVPQHTVVIETPLLTKENKDLVLIEAEKANAPADTKAN